MLLDKTDHGIKLISAAYYSMTIEWLCDNNPKSYQFFANNFTTYTVYLRYLPKENEPKESTAVLTKVLTSDNEINLDFIRPEMFYQTAIIFFIFLPFIEKCFILL